MRKLMFATAAAMALGCLGLALAADGSSKAPGAVGERVVYSYAKNHHVLKFLGLTDEQVQKIDALNTEKNAAVQALYKDRPKDPKVAQEFYKAVGEKAKTLNDEFNKKVMDVLTAEQKTKYQEAEKIYQECEKAQREAMVKNTIEREDKLVKVLGDSYKEQADKVKKDIAVEGRGLDQSR